MERESEKSRECVKSKKLNQWIKSKNILILKYISCHLRRG
jgi:hypothetical protein